MMPLATGRFTHYSANAKNSNRWSYLLSILPLGLATAMNAIKSSQTVVKALHHVMNARFEGRCMNNRRKCRLFAGRKLRVEEPMKATFRS